RKRPGARNGHPGVHRPAPLRIDRCVEHRAACCPDCGGALQRCNRTRKRITEDLPENIPPLVTEHTIHRDYCPRCKKDVEPRVPDALPSAALGHRVVSFASWCHYGLGVTIDQLLDILQFHLQTRLSAGGMVAIWQRLADVLTPWYEQIAQQAKAAAHLHADETGWRVQGQTCWLWCFANGQVCYYMIDRCRGSPVLHKFFGDAFDGILLHDFWSAYESIDVADRQYCLVHLLRESEKVDEHNATSEWRAFSRTLRRLIRDGIRLRKNSQSNRSEQDAAAQAARMSIYRTLKLRGHDPLRLLENTLRRYVQTGQRPSLPETIVADGGTVTKNLTIFQTGEVLPLLPSRQQHHERVDVEVIQNPVLVNIANNRGRVFGDVVRGCVAGQVAKREDECVDVEVVDQAVAVHVAGREGA
ncbi:MAG: transposase, partial [Phycisphaerales bacterium]|nr:transposase [Phycisphaerales bacterium]